VNTFRRRRRFNVAAPKAGGKIARGRLRRQNLQMEPIGFGLAWPPHGGELVLEAVGPAGPVTQALVKVLGSQLPIPSYLSKPYDLPGRTNQNNPIRNRSQRTPSGRRHGLISAGLSFFCGLLRS
jgi:hypothetical protein